MHELQRAANALYWAAETDRLGPVRTNYLSLADRLLRDAHLENRDDRLRRLSSRARLLARKAPMVGDRQIREFRDQVLAVQASLEEEAWEDTGLPEAAE